MLTIGLTGQSGAGKGVFSEIFCTYDGVVCIDTDKTARSVVEKGKPCLGKLCECFGDEILLSDGTLDRRKLAAVAFTDKEKHNCLNEITHFYIMKEINAWLSDMEKQGAKVAIIDAPLLFESTADKLCDMTIGIISPKEKRLERIIVRDNIDEKNARIRLDSQPDDSFFEEKCTHILVNDSSVCDFEIKARKFIEEILRDTERYKV